MTRADVLARIAAVEPGGGDGLDYVLAALKPLWPSLDAGTPDQLLSRLESVGWRPGAPVRGACWSDGVVGAGFVELVILNASPPQFYAVTSTGHRQRLEVAGKAFVALPGG